jgi:hypothetical protein
MPAPASPGLPLQLGMVLATPQGLPMNFIWRSLPFVFDNFTLAGAIEFRRLEGDRLVILPDSQFGSRIRFTAPSKTTRGATIDHFDPTLAARRNVGSNPEVLGVMRDPQAPTDLRIRVARAAAPLVHGKRGIAPPGAGKAGAIRETDGFAIDIEEAKALRDIEHRLAVFLRKRFGPSENGGLPTDAEIVEESKLDAMFHKRAAALECPPGYRDSDAMKDSDRLHQLNCKRLSPPSCGGGELKGADDDEEALLTARLAAYRHSPEGRDRARRHELMFKRRLSVDEQDELGRLKAEYPEAPRETPLGKAIALRQAELRQRSK